MLRLCRQCGREYEGDPGSSLCPECVKLSRSSTLDRRQCRQCGTVFYGGPRAWYCPGCRAERKKAVSRAAYERRLAGNNRLLGSADICARCGGTYTVTGPLQRYCPACAGEAAREADREAGRRWYAEHGDPDARRQQKKAAAAPIPCAVCGKPFVPSTATVCCSDACRQSLHRERQREADLRRPPRRKK